MAEQPANAEQPTAEQPTSYDPAAIEQKWQQVWDDLDPFRADDAAVASVEKQGR